jgi:hypothetical protein
MRLGQLLWRGAGRLPERRPSGIVGSVQTSVGGWIKPPQYPGPCRFAIGRAFPRASAEIAPPQHLSTGGRVRR